MNLNDVNRGIQKHKKRKRARPRHRLGPRQDRRPRPQGPEVALAGWSTLADLRRRHCRSIAPHPQARLQQRAGPDAWPSVNVGDLERSLRRPATKSRPNRSTAKNLAKGRLRRAEDPGQRRADQEAQDLGPSLQRSRPRRRSRRPAAKQSSCPAPAPVVKVKKQPRRPPRSQLRARETHHEDRSRSTHMRRSGATHRRCAVRRSSTGYSEGRIEAMWEKLRVIFTIPELRQKILLTLLLLAIYRVGCQIPLPIVDQHEGRVASAVDRAASATCSSRSPCSAPASSSQATIFGLGIMPYISASIIFQLLGSVWPPLERAAEGRRERPQEDQRIHALRHRVLLLHPKLVLRRVYSSSRRAS